jgi:hypothetical protein
MMKEKEKYLARIEAQMESFDTTIEEISTKAKLRETTKPDFDIENLRKNLDNANAKLKEVKASDENGWQNIKGELDQLVEGVDNDLRNAMAYFG